MSYSDKPDFVTAAAAPAAGVGSNLEVADVGEDEDVWVAEEEEEVGEVVEEGQQEEREHADQDPAQDGQQRAVQRGRDVPAVDILPGSRGEDILGIRLHQLHSFHSKHTFVFLLSCTSNIFFFSILSELI